MKKRILALLMAAVMLISAWPVHAHAVETDPAFVVDTVTASAGESVDVTVRVENNPGITSIKMALEYDDALTFVGAAVNDALGSNFLTSPEGKYPVMLNWYDGLKNVTGDWVFVTLSFTVAEDAALGMHSVSITYNPNDVFDVNENNVTFRIENGGVEVVPAHVGVTGISLSKTALSLTEGETAALTASVTPEDATDKTVTFTSSDPSVATVDADGKVTAIKAGTATVTATAVDSGLTAACTVTVACAHSKKTEIPAAAADCVNPGNNRYFVCDACAQAFKADGTTKTTVAAETIPATGHTLTPVSAAEATCEEAGHTAYYTCSCGKWFADADAAREITDRNSVVIPATGHSFTEYVSDANATCVEDGTETAICDNCDATDTRVISGSREDAAHSFPEEYTSDGNATCTADGTKSRVCTLCGEKETVTDVGSATGHSFGAWYVVTEAGCTEDGQERRDCENCDHFETRTAAATGHDYAAVVTAPTCTERGYTTHTCANCGHSYVDSYVDAAGHTYGNWYVTKEAGCISDGQERRDCANCDHYETRAVAAAGHDYEAVVTAPTCTERGFTTHTCQNCDHSYVDSYTNATGHNFGDWYVTKDATCTVDGQERRDCGNCDHFETRTVAATGHDYASVVTAPTCTERGFTTHTCQSCGHSYVDSYVDATGHSFGDWHVTKEADCTAEGQERRDCGNCDHFETRTVAATGHDYAAVVTAPTCTERGFTTHTCQNCGHSYVDSYTNAAGHTYGNWYVTKEATCTTNGQEQRDCANCDHYETRTVAATGHDYASVVTAPTCTERGYTTHTCANCGHSYVDSYTNATGHSFGDWHVTKEATCTVDGQERRDCANCDHYETRAVAAAGHDYEAVVTAPTCTERGFTTHTCANCGHSYVDSNINATGHTFGDWYVTEEASCTTDGQEQRNCENCDRFETRAVAATGHNYAAVVTAPTCTERGFTTHVCANCGHSYVDSYINATGHGYGEWYVTKEATLEAEGEERRDCSRCDDFQTRVIPMLVHSYTDIVTAPTCTERGFTTHTCANCGHTYTDTYVPALGHDFANYVSNGDATCTQDGTKTAKCTRCDATDTVTDRNSATGHTYGEWYVTKDATCTVDGQERRDCENCDHFETRTVAATGHDYAAVVTAPTCTERGFTTHTCQSCGHSYVDSYTNATGHNFGDWYVTKEADCTAEGQERRDCGNCDHFETRTVAATGHDYAAAVTAPTCTERGFTTHTCQNCDHSYVDSYTNATGHNFGDWVITKPATRTEEGERQRSCHCGETETEIIPAAGYALGDVNHDGYVDGADAMLLRQFVARWKLEVFHSENADMDGSGVIDGADAMLLRQLIAG